MSLSDDKVKELVLSELAPAERDHSAVYLYTRPIPKGRSIDLPRLTLNAPWDARLAFVDREPRANWGHSCRYLMIAIDTGIIVSLEGRFPPFQSGDLPTWLVIYQAPDVPDSALAIPKP
jgi:hypothetical protein